MRGYETLKKKKEDKKCKKHIDPDSILARNWSILLLICLAWVAVIMPFILGFVEEPQGFLKYGAMFVDYFFILDIFFNFFAATREEDGTLTTKNKRIALNYLNGWFFFDLIASFPFEKVINFTVKYRTNSGPVDN